MLYVAMTRAKEKLVAVISLKEAESKLVKLSYGAEYPLSPQILEACESMGDWLLLTGSDQPGVAHYNRYAGSRAEQVNIIPEEEIKTDPPPNW